MNSILQQPTTKIATPGSLRGRIRDKFNKRILLLAVSFILVISTSWLVVFQTNLFGKKTQGYKYSQLSTYQVKAGEPGAAINFKVPVEFRTSSDFTYDPTVFDKFSITNFVYTQPTTPYASVISVGVRPTYIDPTQAYLDTVGKTLKKPTTDIDYRFFTSVINQFARTTVNNNLDLSLGQAKPFTNSSIRSNAWEFEVRVKNKTDKKNNPSNQKGKAVYAITHYGYYYFISYDTDYNWNNNQRVWREVLNSLKLDQ